MRSRFFLLPATFGLVCTIMAAGCGEAASKAEAQASSATRFVRDPARFKANQQKLIDAMRPQSPEAAVALQQAFAQDVLGTLAPEMRRLGLNDQDMADMTAVYWVSAWEAAHGIVGRETDPALIGGARNQIARTLSAGAARMSDGDKEDVADTMLLQALLIDARMKAAKSAGAAMQKQMSDTVYAEAAQLLKTDLRQVKLTPAGFAPASGASPGAAASDTGALTAGTGNWQQVEGVYFKSYSTFGVGGMMIQDFEPVVLFRDGSYYEVEGEALEDVDLAISRRKSPSSWGRWRRQADTFLLTDHRGSTNDYELQQGSFFKAFPAEAAGSRLSRPYKRISGGGNSALGGTMAIAAQTNLTFAPDGRFTTDSNMGASGASVAAYSRRPRGVGRYRIARHTITFTDPDGRTRREFFALGSQDSPARLDTDMIFIGDRVFVKDD